MSTSSKRGGSAQVDLSKAKRLSEWPKMRGEIEAAVMEVVGLLPKERTELQIKTLDEMTVGGVSRRRINYFVDEWERVSAWLFVPEGRDRDMAPGILCCHRMTPLGKDESAGFEGDHMLAFAHHFAELGYATLAPDTIGAGERVSIGLEPFDTKSFYKDHPKMSALGKMLWDHVHALDALCEIRRIDPERIGVIGHDLGALNALLLTAFDERVQACVASCGFTRMADDDQPERYAPEAGFVMLPRLRAAIKSREFPFDWEHVLALAAPSPVLLVTALNDAVLPNTKSCEKAYKLARSVYMLLGESDAMEHHVHNDGHIMTPETLQKADEWFERWL